MNRRSERIKEYREKATIPPPEPEVIELSDDENDDEERMDETRQSQDDCGSQDSDSSGDEDEEGTEKKEDEDPGKLHGRQLYWVNKVLKRRVVRVGRRNRRRKTYEYLVSWYGCDATENTWEPRANFKRIDLLNDFDFKCEKKEMRQEVVRKEEKRKARAALKKGAQSQISPNSSPCPSAGSSRGTYSVNTLEAENEAAFGRGRAGRRQSSDKTLDAEYEAHFGQARVGPRSPVNTLAAENETAFGRGKARPRQGQSPNNTEAENEAEFGRGRARPRRGKSPVNTLEAENEAGFGRGKARPRRGRSYGSPDNTEAEDKTAFRRGTRGRAGRRRKCGE